MTVMQAPPALGQVSCIHCASGNVASAAFCEACGKALPSPHDKPRIVTGKSVATSHAGMVVQSASLQKHLGGAWKALLLVAALHVLGGGVGTLILANNGGEDEAIAVAVMSGVISAIYCGLALWARNAPLPASICGLAGYLSLLAIGALMNPLSLLQGWILKVIIIAVLAKAISAGLKARQIEQQMREADVC